MAAIVVALTAVPAFTAPAPAALLARPFVTPVDLGTLGGARSEATAVSGTVVVGTSDRPGGPAGDPPRHAFAVDLAARPRHRLDLGTLGGRNSRAAAVDGSIVVGDAEVDAAGHRHAFAYDLLARWPIRDLGTLGGAESWAVAIDHGVVAGNAATASGVLHAFAYDLWSPAPKMRDLGSLDGPGRASAATAVSDGVVVGQADVPDWGVHAFAYDLRAPAPKMQDLGVLGPCCSVAVAVSHGLVVGTADRVRTGGSGFAYDLRAARPAMRDLGTLGGPWSRARAVHDRAIVGGSGVVRPYDEGGHAWLIELGDRAYKLQDISIPVADDAEASAVSDQLVAGRWWLDRRGRGFAYDRADPAAGSRDLGYDTDVAAVSGRVVVGQIGVTSTRPHAAAWIVSEPTRRGG